MSDNVKQLKTTESIGPGSLVVLKTGGPCLVVVERISDKAHCLWHDNDGSLHDLWIPTIALKVS